MKLGNQVQKVWKSIHRNRRYSIFGHNGIPMIWLENENCSNFGQDEAIFKIFVSNSTNLAMPDPFLASTVHFDDLFFIRPKSEICPKFDGPILILTMNCPTFFIFLLKTFKWFSKKIYPWTSSQYAVKNDHFFTFCPPVDQKIPRAKILSFLFVDPMGTYKCMLDGFGQDHSCGQKWPSKFHFIRIFQNFKRP